MTTTELTPAQATLIELARGVLHLSRMADENRTAADHRRVITQALPCVTQNIDHVFHCHLIDQVLEQEGIK